MTVIMFQPQFAPKVEDGSKQQTVRPPRKRPILVGEKLSLRKWSGRPYMTPQVVLREAVCIGVDTVRLNWSNTGMPILLGAGLLVPADADAFAIADGFESSADMQAWFEKTHGLPFTGILIRWAL